MPKYQFLGLVHQRNCKLWKQLHYGKDLKIYFVEYGWRYVNKLLKISKITQHNEFQSVLSNYLETYSQNHLYSIANHWTAGWYTMETLYSTIYYSKYFIELNIDKCTQCVALWTHKNTPYLALSGELWSVFYEYFNRNRLCYKGFLLYTYKYASPQHQ